MTHASARLLSLLICAGLLSGATAFAATASPASPASAAFATPAVERAPLVTGLPDFTSLVRKVAPAVVAIRSLSRPPDNAPGEDLFKRFGGSRQTARTGRMSGAGFLISADGYLLSTDFVVEGADEVQVTLRDGRVFQAAVAGVDQRSGVALLKIDAANLPHLPVGTSDKVEVGAWVIAIGSPFDLDHTVTAGIISATARETGDYLPSIQSDVAINPGNAGGPLINMRGEAIGILSKIATASGYYNGVSFALPIDGVMRVAEQLKAHGRVRRGRIGVEVAEVSQELAESLGLGKARGAAVTRVEAGSPADQGGIQAGDIVIAFNKQPIERSKDLERLVAVTAPGSKAGLTLWRRGKQQEAALSVSEVKDDKVSTRPPVKQSASEQSATIGLSVTDLNEATRNASRRAAGVIVSTSSGAAADAGVTKGDLILQVNSIAVDDARHFTAIVAGLDPRKSVALLVRQGTASQYVVIKPRQ